MNVVLIKRASNTLNNIQIIIFEFNLNNFHYKRKFAHLVLKVKKIIVHLHQLKVLKTVLYKSKL